MSDENDEEDSIPEKVLNSNNILSEDEKLDCIDMTPYKERINNILGTKYSYYFFQCFDFVYNKREVHKITTILSEYLTKANRKGDSSWMVVYKSVKLYSSKNLPLIVNKYIHQKAEVECKYILSEAKKHTTHTSKFIEVYLRKMKNFNKKKMQELNKEYDEDEEIFEMKSKTRFKNFVSRKTILNSSILKAQTKKLAKSINKNDDDDIDDSLREKKIKEKQMRHQEIMKQIHRLRIKTMKEVEKSNNIQTKQKRKYGGIKSRYLDVFNDPKYPNYYTRKNSCVKVITTNTTNTTNNNSRRLYSANNSSKNKFFRELNFKRNKTLTNEFDVNFRNEQNYLNANKSKDKERSLRRNQVFLNKNAFKDYENFNNLLSFNSKICNNSEKSKKFDVQRMYSLCNDIINSEEYDRIGNRGRKGNKLYLKAPKQKKERPKSSYFFRENQFNRPASNRKNIRNKNHLLLKNIDFWK